MSVYRPKKSPYYQFDFEIEGYRFSGSTKLRDERDAQAFEDARRIEARDLVDRLNAEGRGPLRLKPACDRWWNEHGSTLSDAKVKSVLDRLVEIMGAKKYLHAITDNDVSEMVQERRKDTRRDRTVIDGDKKTILYRPITNRTVNRTIDLLRQVMYRARDNWSVAILRMPKWKNHKLEVFKGHVNELSASEETALDEAEDFDYAELRRFATITGLRLKNLFLTHRQVDFELRVIRIIAKGKKARVIPMTREIYAMLWRRRHHHPIHVWTAVCKRKWRNARNRKDVREVGKRYPITYYGFESRKDRAWKKAGVHKRIHDLRHTTGMRTLRKTRNLRLVQELLGHTDIKTTAEFYTTALVEDLREGMEETTAPRQAAGKPKRTREK